MPGFVIEVTLACGFYGWFPLFVGHVPWSPGMICMGLCAGKLGGGGDCVDILETTAWIRGVVTGHQAKRKGQNIF
jgi:hypothetical protein